MATVIRFSRHGTKKKPYFRIVVQDHRKPRDGRFIEHIGAFVPTKGVGSLVVSRPRLEYWLSVGAQLSESVKNRLGKQLKEWGLAGAKAQAAAPAPRPSAAAREGH